MKIYVFLIFIVLFAPVLSAQEIQMQQTASLEQVYGQKQESEGLLPMNDLDMDFGYVLYQTEIVTESEDAVLAIENVRDYASVYVDDKLQGELTDNGKKITLPVAAGKHTLQLYAENIGRITYGPEILDNLKGLFGSITLDGEEITSWEITPLNVKDCSVKTLIFTENSVCNTPCFHKGVFELTQPKDTYLDMSGWGMGEVWINGQYLGSFWEKSPEKTIQITADILMKGKNEVIVFELKNMGKRSVSLTDEPLFK